MSITDVCTCSPTAIRQFISAAEDNWRNAIYVECKDCKYRDNPNANVQSNCGDFLFVPDVDGKPCLLPVNDAMLIFARPIAKDECVGLITNYRFFTLYTGWFALIVGYEAMSPYCPLQSYVEYTHTLYQVD